MKILAIDCGNTRIKWGLWDGAAWLRVGAMTHDELGDARSGIAPAFASLPPPAHIAIANVAGEGVRATVERALASINAPIMWARSTERQCGVINRYGAPATLGVDRWAALIGARHVQPGACIVVGAGTATTIDLLSASGEFRGGVILPGLDLMKRSLAEHTARLPLADGAYADEPRSTEDAIESGALHAQAGAIERILARMKEEAEAGPSDSGELFGSHELPPLELEIEQASAGVSEPPAVTEPAFSPAQPPWFVPLAGIAAVLIGLVGLWLTVSPP